MKLQVLMMVALLTSVIGSTVTAAPPQDDRMFGGGRFLRRLTGRSEEPQPKPKSAQPKKAAPKSSARPGSGKAPTPARKPGSAPTPAKPSTTNRPTSMNRTPNRLPKPATNPNARVGSGVKSTIGDAETNLPPASTRSAKKPTMGFGMLIETRGKDMIVTQIDPKGNAQDAGVRRGDIVLAAGGVDLESIDEFNGITEILGQGDQLEFKISRRGKTEKKLIQFGEPPKEGEVTTAKPPETAPGPKTGKYDFVPKSGSGLRSVMQGDLQTTPRQSQARGQLSPNQNSPVTASRAPSSVVNQTIEQQRRQIERMQREIQRLRQSQSGGSSVIEPATSSSGGIIFEGPALSGPKK
ncbi:MAG: PDZ domain-containing protein [Mariniblastus sp.]